MTVCGVLLAGGESRRFGTPKAFATYNELPFYKKILTELNTLVTTETLIITKPELLNGFELLEKVKIVTDDKNYAGMGPLAGVYTAMLLNKASYYVVVACDMPLVSRNTLFKLVGEARENPEIDAVVPVVNGRYQPLCAVYHARCRKSIEKHLSIGNRRVLDVLKQLRVRYVVVDEREEQFTNVNTREDYRLIRRERN